MTRVKRGIIKAKRRRNILLKVKGYKWGRSKKERQAKEALAHAGNYAFNDRRKKKANFRQVWHIHITSGLKESGLSFSKFMNKLHTNNITVNKKMLALLANDHKESFDRLVLSLK